MEKRKYCKYPKRIIGISISGIICQVNLDYFNVQPCRLYVPATHTSEAVINQAIFLQKAAPILKRDSLASPFLTGCSHLWKRWAQFWQGRVIKGCTFKPWLKEASCCGSSCTSDRWSGTFHLECTLPRVSSRSFRYKVAEASYTLYNKHNLMHFKFWNYMVYINFY